MVLVHRQWRWGTYGHTNPWAAHFTSTDSTETSSEHFATTASETTQTLAVSSVSTSSTTTTTLVPVAAAAGTTDSSTEQASTEPAPLRTTGTATPTTSPTMFPLSIAGETTSRSTSERGASHSLSWSSSTFFSFSLSGGLTVSLPSTGSAAQSTTSESSSTAQPVATGSGANSDSSDGSHGLGKGAIAAIALGIVFGLGLVALVYYCCKRRAGRRRDSTFIQYPFSSDVATGRMSDVPHVGATVPPNTPADWETRTDMAESLSATVTFGSPTTTGASGYWGGRAMYPLDEKSPLPLPSPSTPDNNAFDPATTAPSPNSTTAFALSFPMPPSPLSRPPASPSRPVSPTCPSSPSRPASPSSSESGNPIAPPLPVALPDAGPSALPYAWDHPPPSSEYLPPRTPDRRSTFRSSRTGPTARRASAGTVAATPIYSSGVPEVDRQPPLYTRY